MNLEHFKTYIKDVRGVSDKTVKHYETALFTINAFLEKYQFEIPNIFLTTDISELDKVKVFLDQNSEFQMKDTVGHRMYSVAFKHYYRFSMWYSVCKGESTVLEKIKLLISEYSDIYAQAWASLSFKHPIASMVRNEIAQGFRDIDFLDPHIYTVKASCGTGRFAAVPWIAIFDQRITDTAQKGVYIVYLLNKDTKDFYLTLNQAATGLSLSELKENAKRIKKLLNISTCDPITTGADAYDAGCILSKKYTISD